MRSCIEALESRQFLSVTPMTLANEVKAIQIDASADHAAVDAIAERSSTDLSALKHDLRGATSANQALLKAVEVAESQYVAKLEFDVNSLLNATGLAQQSASDGTKLIKHSTNKRIAAVQADIAALNSATPGPPSAIRVDEQSTSVSTALAALVSANSSNSALAADAGKLNSDNAIIGATIVADSQTFAFTIGDLANDLSTLVP